MKRTRVITIAACSMLAMAAASCGSSSEVSTAGEGPDDSTPADEVPNEPGDATLPDGPLGAGPYPIATLNVTVTHPSFDDINYVISCLGDTATMTPDIGLSASQACLDLAEPDAKHLLVEGPAEQDVCTEQYGGPDIALIVGEIDGEQVDTALDRVNGCSIHDWETLGAALPTSQGLE